MYIVILFFGIIIQLIIITLLALVIAVPLCAIISWRSRKNKKRNAIMAFLSTFLFVYTFYFIILIGSFICSAIFHTGCGMDGYYEAELPNGYCITSIDDEFGEAFLTGSIIKQDTHIISDVAEIKVTGDSIYGKQYSLNQSPKNGHYFLLDTKNDNYKLFPSYDEAIAYNPEIVSGLTQLGDFYVSRCKWIIPLALFALFSASGAVVIMCFFNECLAHAWNTIRCRLQ